MLDLWGWRVGRLRLDSTSKAIIPHIPLLFGVALMLWPELLDTLLRGVLCLISQHVEAGRVVNVVAHGSLLGCAVR